MLDSDEFGGSRRSHSTWTIPGLGFLRTKVVSFGQGLGPNQLELARSHIKSES